MTDERQCTQLASIKIIEHKQKEFCDAVTSMQANFREDFHAMRNDVDTLTEIVNDMKVEFKGLSTSMLSFLDKMADRDKQVMLIQSENKETFKRFGGKLDKLEYEIDLLKTKSINDIKEIEVKIASSEWVSKLAWAVVGGAAAVVGNLIIGKGV